MEQLIQVFGAILILIAFGANQRGTMSPHSTVYLTLNLAGSVVLTALALHDRDWGFFLLEFVWAIVSLYGLMRIARGLPPAASH